MRETVTFSLPAGFVVDEMPEAVSLKTEFGTYSTKYEPSAGKLVFTRTLSFSRTLVPSEKYRGVQQFFAALTKAEQAPVVLARN